MMYMILRVPCSVNDCVITVKIETECYITNKCNHRKRVQVLKTGIWICNFTGGIASSEFKFENHHLMHLHQQNALLCAFSYINFYTL